MQHDECQADGRHLPVCGAGHVVACLGLSHFCIHVEQRSKEINVRIVLGATMNNIVQLLTGNFVKLVPFRSS